MSVITINRIKRKCDQCGKTIPKGRTHAVQKEKTVSRSKGRETDSGYISKHYHTHCRP